MAALALSAGAHAAPLPGNLLDAAPVSRHGAADVDILLATLPQAADAGRALCGVAIDRIDYATGGLQGRPARASAVLMMPTGFGPDCNGPRPVLLYAQGGTSGTNASEQVDMADAAGSPEALAIEGYFAARGYIVIAPDDLGDDGSSAPANAETRATAMIDGLRAGLQQVARAGLARASATLFLAGYAQGAAVAMATQRALERDHADEFTVAASVPMAGAYGAVAAGWRPRAPMALCAGSEDPAAPYADTVGAARDFARGGLHVPVWDLEARSTLPPGMRYDDIYDAFQFAKLRAGSDARVKYHAELAAPACYALARGYFAEQPAAPAPRPGEGYVELQPERIARPPP